MSVYFITCRELGFVKIGVAFNPFVRLASLQTAFPLGLKVEALFKGANKREKAFHKQFAEHRMRGEWFRLCPEIEAKIAQSEHPPIRPCSLAQKKRLHAMHGDPEPLGPHLPPPHILDQWRNDALRAANPSHGWGWGRHDIRRLEKSGDIHFPFRATEAA